MNKRQERIAELKKGTKELMENALAASEVVPKATLQFIEGAITLSELNLRVVELMLVVNEFGRQMDEMNMYESFPD